MTRFHHRAKLAAHLDLLHPRALSGNFASAPSASSNWSVTSSARPALAGAAMMMSRQLSSHSFILTICAAALRSPLQELCGTTRWIYAASPLSSAKSTPCFPNRAPRGRLKASTFSGIRDFCNAGRDRPRTFGVFSSVRDRTPG